MKRTKEAFSKPHPHFTEREGFSGCREFDGEDLDHDSRRQYFKNQQREWLDQHQYQKDMESQQEKFEEHLYAKQVQETTRMRQMLEDNFKQKKASIQNSLKEENQILAQQKKDREMREKQERLTWEVNDVNNMIERGQPKQYKPVF